MTDKQPTTPSELQEAQRRKARVTEQAPLTPEVMDDLKRKYDNPGEDSATPPPGEKLKPYSSETWDAPWGATYTFIMPSAEAFNRLVRDQKFTIYEDGGVTFNPSAIMPLVDDFVRPRPNVKELIPGDWRAMLLAFYNFLFRTNEQGRA